MMFPATPRMLTTQIIPKMNMIVVSSCARFFKYHRATYVSMNEPKNVTVNNSKDSSHLTSPSTYASIILADPTKNTT